MALWYCVRRRADGRHMNYCHPSCHLQSSTHVTILVTHSVTYTESPAPYLHGHGIHPYRSSVIIFAVSEIWSDEQSDSDIVPLLCICNAEYVKQVI